MSTKTNDSTMHNDTMRPEYDMTGAVRGKYAGRLKGDVHRVSIEPDVAEAFPDSASVNEALRVLIKAAKKATGRGPPAA